VTTGGFVASDVWMRAVLEGHRTATSERGLLLHTEFDRRFQIRPSPELERGVDALVRFVLATVPDGCEIFVASTRDAVPVAPLGAGMLTFRWQVTGVTPPRGSGNVRPLRPVSGAATKHIRSKAARRIVKIFGGLAAEFELSAIEGDRELWARVTIPP